MEICECKSPTVVREEGKNPYCKECGRWYDIRHGSYPETECQEMPRRSRRNRILAVGGNLASAVLTNMDRMKGHEFEPPKGRTQKDYSGGSVMDVINGCDTREMLGSLRIDLAKLDPEDPVNAGEKDLPSAKTYRRWMKACDAKWKQLEERGR